MKEPQHVSTIIKNEIKFESFEKNAFYKLTMHSLCSIASTDDEVIEDEESFLKENLWLYIGTIYLDEAGSKNKSRDIFYCYVNDHCYYAMFTQGIQINHTVKVL